MKTLILAPISFLFLSSSLPAQQTVTGQAAFADWNQQQPGVRRKITLADLPQPKPEENVRNQPTVIPRPADAWPIAPPGFKVTLYAAAITARCSAPTPPSTWPRPPEPSPSRASSAPHPTAISSSPTQAPQDRHPPRNDPRRKSRHHRDLRLRPRPPLRHRLLPRRESPIRLHRERHQHRPLPVQIRRPPRLRIPETVVASIPGYAQLAGGGHWTRDVVFTKDGSKMLVSVGSGSNINNPDTDNDRSGGGRDPKEFHRADVLEYTPEGKFLEVYASGIRNCVGEAINPITGSLWCSVNERDELGNHLVPDYVTSVPEGSFFGWPWYYMGGHQDPRLPQPCADGTAANPQATAESPDPAACKHVDLSAKVRTPDVLVQPHMASLEMTFYPSFVRAMSGSADGVFPSSYDGGAFAAEHGSWNRQNRAGYEIIYIPLHNGKADGSYEDFLTGFVTPQGGVWGRPVGVTIAKDGTMFVTDDGSRSVWHVTYTGK